nr:TRIC cation channel family protein [Stenotrophomonas acidaminiphila]
MDIFGVLVLSFAAALAGGITRDLYKRTPLFPRIRPAIANTDQSASSPTRVQQCAQSRLCGSRKAMPNNIVCTTNQLGKQLTRVTILRNFTELRDD